MPTQTHRGTGDRPREPSDPDEISLYDLYRVVARRKILFLGWFVVCLSVGVAYAVTAPPKFEWRTAVELGQIPVPTAGGESLELIDTPAMAHAKVQDGFLSKVLTELNAGTENRKSPRVFEDEIKVSVLADSNLLTLSAVVPEDLGQLYRDAIDRTVTLLVREHAQITGAVQARYEAELERARLRLAELEDDRIFAVQELELVRKIDQAERRLAALQDEARLIERRLQNLEIERRLVTSEIEKTEGSIAAAFDNRKQALGEADNPGSAIVVLMIDSELLQNRDRLARLRERLEVSLPDKRNTLENALADNRRAQQDTRQHLQQLNAQREKLRIDRARSIEAQQQEIRRISAKLGELRPTRVVLPATRSIDPVGAGPAMVIALAAVLGLMSGLFGIFLLEFLASARRASLHAVAGPEREVEIRHAEVA